ncbi:MAG TPA: hypothetical protein PLU80_02690, partial [Acidobacteriota bacterium]|nr:hypothetical protein [Acidobacteriota bacterium]
LCPSFTSVHTNPVYGLGHIRLNGVGMLRGSICKNGVKKGLANVVSGLSSHPFRPQSDYGFERG